MKRRKRLLNSSILNLISIERTYDGKVILKMLLLKKVSLCYCLWYGWTWVAALMLVLMVEGALGPDVDGALPWFGPPGPPLFPPGCWGPPPWTPPGACPGWCCFRDLPCVTACINWRKNFVSFTDKLLWHKVEIYISLAIVVIKIL